MVRVLAFSDLHLRPHHAAALREASADADLVIGAGDFCNARKGLKEAMELLWPFTDKAVYVPGNAESADELRAATEAKVLHGEGAEVQGLKLYGLGYAVPETPFGEWSCDLSEQQAEAMLAGMGAVDVLISHSPPNGVADVTSRGRSVGSKAVRAAIERAQPRYCFCGHVHDSWGVTGLIGATSVHNLGPQPRFFDL